MKMSVKFPYLKPPAFSLFFVIAVLVISSPATSETNRKYTYQTFEGDPLCARIYTLDNDLTVYMTAYKDEPRIQTRIAVKVGHKNDPPDATGLAHYLEHMLFKGTDEFGTKDYRKEKTEIDKIIDLYERRYHSTDSLERAKIYHQIDSISGVASSYAIANEYDKTLGALGAKGTNAYTTPEQTVYVNDIPSNQLENWLTLEVERFRDPVMRLFHTELEVVYEEKNKSLDNDFRKTLEALNAGLFQKHPYGTQTTLGRPEHLKNPSLKKVIDYYNTYYVPNNMAICLSGDFDPDETIALIDQTFGQLPASEVPTFVPPVEEPILKPIVKEVSGPDAENVRLAFRFRGASSPDADLLTLVDMILMNGEAGLIDLNLNQSQMVIDADTYLSIYKDYCIHELSGRPREGQSLEEVTRLLLSQIELVKNGEIPDWLPQAVINYSKLGQISWYESNYGRAHAFVQAFTLDIPWEDYIRKFDRYAKITKQDIIDFVKEYYRDNYVVVYKRSGEDKNVKKIAKPEITPIQLNREDQSLFTRSILERPVQDLSPVFLDYSQDVEHYSTKDGIDVYFRRNSENDLFQLYYILDMGTNHDRKIGIALDYLQYLGTSQYSPAQLRAEFYKITCSFDVFSSEDRVYVTLSGLSENFERAVALMEELLADAQANPEALDNLVSDIFKKRADAKLSKWQILWQALYSYGMYGPHSPFTNILTKDELESLEAPALIDLIKAMCTYEHHIMYHGPHEKEHLRAILNKYHRIPGQLDPIPVGLVFEQLEMTENTIYVVDYDMKQVEIIMLSKSEPFNPKNAPIRRLFNEYYGGGMSSVVFTTLRESEALAYWVWASYSTPPRKEKAHYASSFIGTQSDKLPEAMAGMTNLLNEMPESDVLLTSCKEAIIKQLQSERITKSDILFDFKRAKMLGLNHDIRKDIYEDIRSMKMIDLKTFHETHIKGNRYHILVLGKVDELDLGELAKYGQVNHLTLEEIFGY
ncbi:MAG: insulinase family protein [Chloroflexi bacterium]|nr:insulinase family protein [Chloroflexota bacterium]